MSTFVFLLLPCPSEAPWMFCRSLWTWALWAPVPLPQRCPCLHFKSPEGLKHGTVTGFVFNSTSSGSPRWAPPCCFHPGHTGQPEAFLEFHRQSRTLYVNMSVVLSACQWREESPLWVLLGILYLYKCKGINSCFKKEILPLKDEMFLYLRPHKITDDWSEHAVRLVRRQLYHDLLRCQSNDQAFFKMLKDINVWHWRQQI